MNDFYKLMAVSSFVMLSVLTWASKPIQNIFENVQKKETVKARLRVCREIVALKDVFEDHTESMFISGCIYAVRGVNYSLYPKKMEQVTKDFADKESAVYEKASNYCGQGAAAYLREGLIKEAIIANLSDTMRCEETFSQAEKLGIKLSDLEEKKSE